MTPVRARLSGVHPNRTVYESQESLFVRVGLWINEQMCRYL